MENISLYDFLHKDSSFYENVKTASLRLKTLMRKQNDVYAAYGKTLAKFLVFVFQYLDKAVQKSDFTVESVIKLYLCETFNTESEEKSTLGYIVDNVSKDYPTLQFFYNDFAHYKPGIPSYNYKIFIDAFDEFCYENNIAFNKNECERNISEYIKTY